MNIDFKIRVPGRGEEIEYEEGDKIYLFEVNFSTNPCKLYAHRYWHMPGAVGPIQLSEDKRYILERLALWIAKDGVTKTEFLFESPTDTRPLRSVDDILAERLARRRPIQ